MLARVWWKEAPPYTADEKYTDATSLGGSLAIFINIYNEHTL